ncbi:MAG: DUF2344 domain-containing protein [Clostridiaceae bacterium]|nr:DUF2344 domain-containing protein [Clostridiaceae bacterium]
MVFALCKLRLIFEKKDKIRYLGHLDILRTFIRALRRAQVPVAYTQGFNPHAMLVFALPIGVGVTSECEIVDIQMLKQTPLLQTLKSINACMPPNSVEVISGEYTDRQMPTITKAEYLIDIISKDNIGKGLIENAMSQKEILIDKKSKKKITQINIMEHIFESELLHLCDNTAKLRFVVSAGNVFNIKPQLLIEAVKKVEPGLEINYSLYHRKRFIFDDVE